MNDQLSNIILAAFLREPSFFDDFSSVVDADMFEDSASKLCINVYIEYVNHYKELPKDQEMYSSLDMYCKRYSIDTTIKQLAIEKLQHCYEMPFSVQYAKENFVRFATLNKLTAAILDTAKDIKTKGENLSDKDYASIQSRIEEAITIKARDNVGVLLSSVADNPKEFIENQNRFDKSTIVKTGFPSFDNAHIAGGPLPGELYVISAPPGRGKSTVLVNIGAYAALQGKDVVHIFIGDNTEADGVLRYCARMTGVTMAQIMLNAQTYLDSWTYLKTNFNLGNVLIGSYPIGGPSIVDIRSFITKNMVKHNMKPSIVIIDYIDNCRKNPNLNSYDALGDIYTGLKNLAEELKLVVWTASQPRVSEWNEERPGLASLAESSKKAHIVDAMMTLNKTQEGRYLVDVPKMRRGMSDFSFEVAINYDKMAVKECFSSRANTPITASPMVSSKPSDDTLESPPPPNPWG